MKKILIFGIAIMASAMIFAQPVIPHRGKIMQVYGGDTLRFGFDGLTVNGQTSTYQLEKTVNITSANLLAGDSLMIIAGETGVKITPTRITVSYDDATTYTHTDTDTTWIYTYSNSLPVKVAGIADSFIEGTFDNQASIFIDEQFADAEAPYWIDLKNFNDGTGTLVITFYYVKK